MRYRRHAWLFAAAACGVGLLRPDGPTRALAAEPPFSTTPYAYTVLEQDLRVLLREFASNVDMRISISDAVQGRVRGQLTPLPPRAFLDRLGTLYGFDWYYDGYLIYVSATSEGVSKIEALGSASFEALDDALKRLGIADSRYIVRRQGDGAFALVAGPPRFVDLVEQTISALQGRAPTVAGTQSVPPGPSTILIYRGADVKRVKPGTD